MKKYNVGIIGYGWAAEAHISAINASPLAQVAAICSSRLLDVGELSAKHGGPLKVYHELDAMLSDPDIHDVSICSYGAKRAGDRPSVGPLWPGPHCQH
jgi:predicted dehydrogenase